MTKPDLSAPPPSSVREVGSVPGIAIDEAILQIVRQIVASSPAHLRELLVRSFEALRISGQMRPMRTEQVATFLAQLVSDIAYAARDPEQTTRRPIATFMDARLMGVPAGSA
jgi:hypothetical protein